MFALGRFFHRRGKGLGNSGNCNSSGRRNFREERGDFTIALIIFSVVLITVATVSYTWPKSTSTRFTAAHVATQALRAGIASVAADGAASSKSDDLNRCRAREAAQRVIDDYRIHGVTMSIANAGNIDLYNVDDIVCDGDLASSVPFLPECVRTGDDTAYLRITIDWYLINPGNLVGNVTSSRASAQENIPAALVDAFC